MRCLVIGGSGQDGTLLAAQLLAEGHSVTGVSRTPCRLIAATYVAADVTNAGTIDAIVSEVRPDQVYFLAAHHRSSQAVPPPLAEDINRNYAVNALAFASLLTSIAEHAPHARTLYASSSRVFGDGCSGLLSETSPKHPTCPYGMSKLAGMHIAEHYSRQMGMFVSSAILFNHESELRPASFLSKKLATAAIAATANPSLTVDVASIHDVVDWGAARDYVAAMRMILNQPQSGDFVVASGCGRTVGDFAEACFSAVGLDWREHVRPKANQRGPRKGPIGDAAKLRLTGWTPRFSFHEMIVDVVRRLIRESKRADQSVATDFREYLDDRLTAVRAHGAT